MRVESDPLCVPFSLINLSVEPIVLDQSTLIVTLHQSETRMEEVYHIKVTNTMENNRTKQKMKRLPTTPSTLQFISSLVDVLKHRKVDLQDVEVPPENKENLNDFVKNMKTSSQLIEVISGTLI